MTNFERHFGWSAEKREGKDADQARRLYEILKETGRDRFTVAEIQEEYNDQTRRKPKQDDVEIVRFDQADFDYLVKKSLLEHDDNDNSYYLLGQDEPLDMGYKEPGNE